MSFRKHPKASLEALIPVEIARALALRAAHEGKRPNRIVAELLAQALEINPDDCGLGSTRSESSCLSN